MLMIAGQRIVLDRTATLNLALTVGTGQYVGFVNE